MERDINLPLATSSALRESNGASHRDPKPLSRQGSKSDGVAPPTGPLIAATSPDTRVVFHVTGFGKFQGVESNPTTVLMQDLPSFLGRGDITQRLNETTITPRSSAEIATRKPSISAKKNSCEILDYSILETSGVGSLRKLSEQLQKHKDKPLTANVQVVCLHFGVHSELTDFLIEQTAWNEATFRVPDEQGWSPYLQEIIEGHRQCLKTDLPTSDIQQRLQLSGFKVRLSDDPGRFVCNWIYYHSLNFSNINNTHSLFVHVPPFEAVSQEDQLRFVRELIAAITKAL